MDTNKKLVDLIAEQKNITRQYEELIDEITVDKELNELENLRKEKKLLKKELNNLEDKYKSEVNDNLALKNSLMEQMISEKVSILNASERKIKLYFDDMEKKQNKLMDFEESARQRIDRAIEISNEELTEKTPVLIKQLNQVEKNLQYLINEQNQQKELLQEEKTNILDDIKKEYEELKRETIDERLIAKKKKENDIEVKIGLNLINKVGIILLLLGVATALRYSYTNWLGDYMKSALGFLFGVLLLGISEWFNRQEKNVFALGLCGGGIGTLYLSVFSSYFMLNTLSLTVATLISLLITVISIVLAKRYESQTITALSLIGGYLPFFSYVFATGLDTTGIYIAMVYLFILNLTILVLSMENRWTFIKSLSFGFNILTSIYLIGNLGNDIVSIVYSFVIFIMYLSIILYQPIHENLKLRLPEIILLGLNTVINFSLTFVLFKSLGWDNFTGFLALVYGIAYYLLGQLTSKKATNLKLTSDIFYLTAMTFAVLMIPFQFGSEWVSLGWLVESTLLIYLFKMKYQEEKKVELAGWVILGLSVGSFIQFDLFTLVINAFVFKYTAVTVALIAILRLYLPEMKQEFALDQPNKNSYLQLYKNFVVLFSWFYLLRMSFLSYDNFIDPLSEYAYFFKPAVFALITALYAYGISAMKILKDRIITLISIGMSVLVVLTTLQLTTTSTLSMESTVIRLFAISVLIVYNIFVFFSVKTLVLNWIKNKKLSVEFYPLSMAIYLLGIIPLFLLNQFNLANANLVISLIFVGLSFAYIFYGFKARYVLIRRFGLFLSMFATAKLFVFDLMFLSTLGKIIAYLSFGVTLLGISFVYQKLKVISEDDIK